MVFWPFSGVWKYYWWMALKRSADFEISLVTAVVLISRRMLVDEATVCRITLGNLTNDFGKCFLAISKIQL